MNLTLNRAFKELFKSYKKSAKERNLTFSLTKEEFAELITKPCVYCGDQQTQVMRGTYVKDGKRYSNGEFWYTGLDRFDNFKGYEVDNVVPCCGVCNKIKYTFNKSELFEHLVKIQNNKSNWYK